VETPGPDKIYHDTVFRAMAAMAMMLHRLVVVVVGGVGGGSCSPREAAGFGRARQVSLKKIPFPSIKLY